MLQESKKKIIIVSMLVAVLIMGVGYSVFSTALRITGQGSILSTWKVEFTAIRTTNKIGGATNKKTPTASALLATFEVDLVQPGDEITYEIDITNFGNVIAEIQGASYTVNGTSDIYLEIDGVKKGDKIAACTNQSSCPKLTLTLRVGYDAKVTSQDSTKSKTIEIKINVGQYAPGNPTASGELIPELEKDLLVNAILKNNTVQSDNGIDFSKVSSDTNGKGLYYRSLGTEGNRVTYYFRGNVTNNYVSFAGKTWRIVRINEDGSVRLISQSNIGSIGSATFNINGDNAFVGYMYGGAESTTMYGDVNGDGKISGVDTTLIMQIIAGILTPTPEQWIKADINFDGEIDNKDKDEHQQYLAGWDTTLLKDDKLQFDLIDSNLRYNATHRNKISSNIKKTLDNWYQSDLISYSSLIADSGFCNDRSIASGLGYGTNITNYGAYNRLFDNKKPQFSCPQTNDLFTTSTSSKGNKALTYPIGLITADEAAYAGGVYNVANNSYYLYNGSDYWTMSSYNFFSSTKAANWRVNSSGSLYHTSTNLALMVRPVINLKSNVEITKGTGTSADPYIVKTS